MAKMFYTLDETKATLGKSEDEIKQFTRDGKLREFRDGPRLMFKADQVEALKGSGGASVNLAGESGVSLNLTDSKGGSGIGLADSLPGSGLGSGLGSGIGSGAGSAGSGMMNLKDDTALAADLGLSGSMGGVPSPGRPGAGTGLSGTSSGTRAGINVFGGDEAEKIDPMAQTSISSAISGSGGADQLSLDAVGSGSGLLDLTRESDDTSLGAELLDEIAPSGGKRNPSASADSGGSMSGSTGDMPEPRGGVVRGMNAPVYIEAPDSLAPFMGGLAFGAAAFIVFGLFVLTAAMLGANPEIVKAMAEKPWNLGLIAGVGAGISIICGVIGFFVGKVAG